MRGGAGGQDDHVGKGNGDEAGVARGERGEVRVVAEVAD